jgi:polysaccharide export outer membrane protein
LKERRNPRYDAHQHRDQCRRTDKALRDPEIVVRFAFKAIARKMSRRAVEQKTSMITILGEGRSARIPATATPERMLDVISRAGISAVAVGGAALGAAGSGTWVLLERNGRRAIALFGALVYEPANNIYAHPNDTIYLYREPQTFLAFGALGTQQQVPFGTWRLSLAEAISRAGGLVDLQADPAAVFLYRGEAREVAERMGIGRRPYEGGVAEPPMLGHLWRLWSSALEEMQGPIAAIQALVDGGAQGPRAITSLPWSRRHPLFRRS